jgi:hypothetical protein
MKKRAVIHVGLPKCGSSSLQFILASNRDLLLRSGFLYPAISQRRAGELSDDDAGEGETPAGHMRLAGALSKSRRRRTPPPPLFLDILDEFENSGARTLVLSSEGFITKSRKLQPGVFGDMAERYDIDIVLVVRRRDRWLLSRYKQNVKNRSHRIKQCFTEFLQRKGRAQFSIFDAITHMQDVVLPGSRVHVFSLDGPHADTVAQFGQVIGVPLETFQGDGALLGNRNAQLFKLGKPINASPSDLMTLFLVNCNRADMEQQAFAEIDEASVELDEASIELERNETADIAVEILSAELSELLLGYGKEGDERLAQRYGLAVETPRPIVEKAGTAYREFLTSEEFDTVAERLLPKLSPHAQNALSSIMTRRPAAAHMAPAAPRHRSPGRAADLPVVA